MSISFLRLLLESRNKFNYKMKEDYYLYLDRKEVADRGGVGDDGIGVNVDDDDDAHEVAATQAYFTLVFQLVMQLIVRSNVLRIDKYVTICMLISVERSTSM